MSYHVNHQYGGLRIPPGQEPQALSVLVTKLTREMWAWPEDGAPAVITHEPYWNADDRPVTFAEAMDEFRLTKEDDESGWRLDDSNDDPRWYDHEKVFELIVPFAREGDIITFVGEDDERWGYMSRGHTCVFLRARIVWHVEGHPDEIVLED